LGSLKRYAFATLVTNPLEHTAYTQDDYYLDKPVNAEDANGAVAFGRYDDLLDRPTRLVAAAGTVVQRQTTYSYNDAARTIATRSDLNTYGDNLLTSELLYDGLGRTVETRKYAPEGTIKTTQVYDAVGRVKRTYNPHINTSEATYGWTETTYDALSRVTRVETFNGSGVSTGVVVSDYSGNQVTVIDQAQKGAPGIGRQKQR
jgi:hypothetical protein